MVIKTLVENEAISDQYGTEHGLSLYIETKKHKLLFDTGASGLFLDNARKMQVDIAGVDLVVISHGHYDHGGGLKAFLQENSQAKVYLHRKAFEKHYTKRSNGKTHDIGINEELKHDSRVILVDDYLRIDEELELFAAVKGREFYSTANRALFMQVGDDLVEDSWEHEQNLIITENGRLLLLAGCAHNGIVNIVKRMIEIKGRPADCVMGGFHLFNPASKESEAPDLIEGIAAILMETGSQYYTGHCTGRAPYEQLKELMQDKLQYLATGSVVKI